MTSYDTNRTALALLGSILFAMLLVAFSNLVFAPERPAVPGFALPSATGALAEAPAAAAPKETPLPVLLAKADAKKGAQDSKVCATCHNFEKGAPPRSGRRSGAWSGVRSDHSRASPIPIRSRSVGGDWTYEKLDHWIADPKGMASATKMAFPGEKDPQKDADILAYLQTLSDNPVPFPKEASAK